MAGWTDQRTVNWGRHPPVDMVWPVGIRVHALGRNMPRRCLRWSLDHASHKNETLVAMTRLINGATLGRSDPAVAGGSYHGVPRGAGAVRSALSALNVPSTLA